MLAPHENTGVLKTQLYHPTQQNTHQRMHELPRIIKHNYFQYYVTSEIINLISTHETVVKYDVLI